jgi:hypothetical protein
MLSEKYISGLLSHAVELPLLETKIRKLRSKIVKTLDVQKIWAMLAFNVAIPTITIVAI